MSDMREKTACFTGHRQLPPLVGKALQHKASKVIMDLYSRGIVYYGCGGALGFDTLMAQVCFRLRDSGVCPKLRVILVAPFEGQESRWTYLQQSTYRDMLLKYDKVVYVSKLANREAFLARNRRLVDASSICIAYCVETHGGTAYTVDYARRKALEIINLAD